MGGKKRAHRRPDGYTRWDGDALYKVRRKWLAGFSAAAIHEQTGYGARKVAVVCAELRRSLGPIGGRNAVAVKRRTLTAAAVVADVMPHGDGRGVARAVSLPRVNAAVRRSHRAWRNVAYWTTAKDVRGLPPTRVLRGAVVRASRAAKLGDGGAKRRALRAALCRKAQAPPEKQKRMHLPK